MKTHVAILALAATAHAAPRTSADYAITAEALDLGGQRAMSADYSGVGSIGIIAGLSTEATAPTLAKHGYIGQLYDLGGFAMLASEYYPAELGTTQLFPVRSADDGTNVVLASAGVAWSIVSGPVSGISPTGVATAGAVFENTTATVRGTLGAEVGELPIYVQDTVPDNFGSYAGDSLGDDWQNQYFGLNNPLAAPGVDADGSCHTNLFKFTAGLDPLDPNSRFVLEITNGLIVGERRLVFQPRLADRTYIIESRLSLGDAWEPLGGTTFADDGDTRTVTDPNAPEPARFYRVRITKP